jgi:diguanylate cyclase (GGDEF)-like protein
VPRSTRTAEGGQSSSDAASIRRSPSIRAARAPAALDAASAAAVLASVGEAAYVWDLKSDALAWTANAGDVLGVDSLARISSGRSFAALLDPASPANRYDAVVSAAARAAEGAGVYEVRYCLRSPRGEEVSWIEDCGRCFNDAAGKPARAQGVVRVVTERHLHEQRMAELSDVDPLTGELNRQRLAEALMAAHEQATRLRGSVGFLLISIDGLGHINRRYGYAIADEVIVSVAHRLRGAMRKADLIGRFSGNKFGLVLHECGPEMLPVAASRFINAVREGPLEISVGPIAVSATAGGVVGPRHARDAGEMMGRAQEALDLAKKSGRGTFHAFAPSVEAEAHRRENLRLTDIIIAALNDRRVELAFQPVVHTATRQPVFFEGLVRLRDVGGAEIDARAIVSAAEKLDLVRLIDHRVLELAGAALRAEPELVLSINISASSVHEPTWMALFGAEMRPEIGRRLIVEITESDAIRDVDATRRFVDRIKTFGCRVAIDDFGAGHTSFRNLRRLGVDLVKIDGSFIANLERAPDDRLFVRTLLELARELGLKTVAEWVQSEEAARTLGEWGCDYLQGALVGLAKMQPVEPTGLHPARVIAG